MKHTISLEFGASLKGDVSSFWMFSPNDFGDEKSRNGSHIGKPIISALQVFHCVDSCTVVVFYGSLRSF